MGVTNLKLTSGAFSEAIKRASWRTRAASVLYNSLPSLVRTCGYISRWSTTASATRPCAARASRHCLALTPSMSERFRDFLLTPEMLCSVVGLIGILQCQC
jgi:hypothetical protein